MSEDEYFNQVLNSHLKEQEDYASWVESHEDTILESYTESLTIEDIPDDFISNMYENEEH